LLVAQICPISSLLAPCQPGAALRDLCRESLFLDTGHLTWTERGDGSQTRHRRRDVSPKFAANRAANEGGFDDEKMATTTDS
jgi:hypothetical protein